MDHGEGIVHREVHWRGNPATNTNHHPAREKRQELGDSEGCTVSQHAIYYPLTPCQLWGEKKCCGWDFCRGVFKSQEARQKKVD